MGIASSPLPPQSGRRATSLRALAYPDGHRKGHLEGACMSPSLGTLCRACMLQRLLGLRSPPQSLPQPPQFEEPIALHPALRIEAQAEAVGQPGFGARMT
jgi:hypothetical protein